MPDISPPSSPGHIAIIGAGFAGSTLALSLNANSIPCTIYDSRSHPSSSLTSTSGIIGLAPNALRVLSHLGSSIYARLLRRGFTHEKVTIYNATGTKLIAPNLGNQRLYGLKSLAVSRRVVQEELVRAVEERGMHVRWGMKCVGVREEGEEGVSVVFENGEVVRAKWIVGADGMFSVLRRYVDPEAKMPAYHGVVRVAGTFSAADAPSVLEKEEEEGGFAFPCILTSKDGNFGIFPADHAGEEIAFSCYFEVPENGRGRAGWKEYGEDRKALAELVRRKFGTEEAAWPKLVKDICKTLHEEKMLAWPTFTAPTLPSWASKHKRVIVIGDSAHGMPPDAGQGAAMALEDAETLGYLFSEFYTPSYSHQPLITTTADDQPDGSLFDKLYEAWERHRKQRVNNVMKLTSRGGLIRSETKNTVLQYLKETTLSLATALGPDVGMHWVYCYSGEEVLKALTVD